MHPPLSACAPTQPTLGHPGRSALRMLQKHNTNEQQPIQCQCLCSAHPQPTFVHLPSNTINSTFQLTNTACALLSGAGLLPCTLPSCGSPPPGHEAIQVVACVQDGGTAAQLRVVDGVPAVTMAAEHTPVVTQQAKANLSGIRGGRGGACTGSGRQHIGVPSWEGNNVSGPLEDRQ